MTDAIRILEDGGNDLAIVNAAKARTGVPPSELLWTCQHSCTPEQIAVCTDLNCEAALTFDEADADFLRELALIGDWAPFDQIRVRLRSSAPLAGPGIQAEGDTYLGSPLAFARLTPPEALRHAFEATFWVAGRLLFSQRVVALEPSGKAAIVFSGSASGRHTIAWGRFLERAIALDAGLVHAPESGQTHPLRSWVGTELGEFGGPDVRVVFRLDAARARALREQAERRAASGAAFTAILTETLEHLGYTVSPGSPAAMLRSLIRQLPLR